MENIFLFFSDTMVPMKNEFNNTESKNNVNPSEQGSGSGAVVHKRRPRYKGTHPRKFSEKYKELNPELYPETIEKVIAKGSTPAGMHIPIAVQEILTLMISDKANTQVCILVRKSPEKFNCLYRQVLTFINNEHPFAILQNFVYPYP